MAETRRIFAAAEGFGLRLHGNQLERGDTIALADGRKIRYLGVDTPEEFGGVGLDKAAAVVVGFLAMMLMQNVLQ
mgnify:CR=1 FL=1